MGTMTDQQKPAVDPSPANPLWVFVCDNKAFVEAWLKDETLTTIQRKSLEHDLKCWVAIEALVDQWLKGKGK